MINYLNNAKNIPYFFRNLYFNISYINMINILNNALDQLLIFKNNFENYINICLNNYYSLNNVYLISNDINYDLSKSYFKINVKEYFDNKSIKKINTNLIDDIIEFFDLGSIIGVDKNTRLLFEYNFKNKDFKYIYSYYIANNEVKNNSIDYPLYNDKFIDKSKENKKISDYFNFLKMNCKDIEYVKINDIEIDKNEIEKFQGPYHDFGDLNNNNIKLEWILKDIQFKEKLKSFEIKYSNPYLDEENFELKDHIIYLQNSDQIIKSELMNNFVIN